MWGGGMHLENVGYVAVLTITNGILPTASTLDFVVVFQLSPALPIY